MLHIIRPCVEEVAYEGGPVKFQLLLSRLTDRGLRVNPPCYNLFLFQCKQCPELQVTHPGINISCKAMDIHNVNKPIPDDELIKFDEVSFDVSDELRTFMLIGDNITKGFDTDVVRKTIYCVARSRHHGCLGVEISKEAGVSAHDIHHVITRLCDYGILIRFSTVIKTGGATTGSRSIVVGKQRTGQQTVFFHFRFCDETKLCDFREEARDSRLAIIEEKVVDLLEAKETKCVLEDDLLQACARCLFDNGLQRRGLHAVYRRITQEMVRKGVVESVKMPCDAEKGSGAKDAFANALALKGALRTTSCNAMQLDPADHKKPFGAVLERSTMEQLKTLIWLAGAKGVTTMDIEDVMGFSTKGCYIWLELLKKQFPLTRTLESMGKFHLNRYYYPGFGPGFVSSQDSSERKRTLDSSTAKAKKAKVSSAKSGFPSPTICSSKDSASARSSGKCEAKDNEIENEGSAKSEKRPRENATRETRVQQVIAHLEEHFVVTFPILKEVLVPPVSTVKTLKMLTDVAIARRPDILMRRKKFGHEVIFLYLPAKISQEDAEAFSMEDIQKRMIGPNKKTSASREVARLDKARKADQKSVEIDVQSAQLNPYEKGNKKAIRNQFDLKAAAFYGFIQATMARVKEWHRYLRHEFFETVGTGATFPDEVVISVSSSSHRMDLLNFCRLIGCAQKCQYVTDYLLAEDQPKTLIKDLPKALMKVISMVLLRNGTHLDTSIQRLWGMLVKLDLAKLYEWPQEEVQSDECNVRPETMGPKPDLKPLSYTMSRYGKLYPFRKKDEKDEKAPPLWYDFADPEQFEEYWQTLQERCLDWGAEATGSKYTAWQYQKPRREDEEDKAEAKSVQIELPVNLNVDAAFRAGSWKSYFHITSAQRRSMEQFLSTWKATEEERTAKKEHPNVLCLNTPELVALSKRIGIPPKHVLEFMERRNSVFTDEAIELTRLKIPRYRCHICAAMVAQHKSIQEHYRKEHDMPLPRELNMYMTPSYLQAQRQHSNYRRAHEPKGLFKRRRKRRRVSEKDQDVAKPFGPDTSEKHDAASGETVDWASLHPIWLNMCGLQERRNTVFPDDDDSAWDILARLTGKSIPYCIQKMETVLRHRYGVEPFDKQDGSQQNRTLKDKLCEMSMACMFMSPPHEYTSQRAYDIMCLHCEKTVAQFHDLWKSRGWIMLSKYREKNIPGLCALGQDRPKFCLTRRAKLPIFGKSCIIYRWWTQLRATMDFEYEGDSTWPEVNGEFMFVASENFESNDAMTMDFIWDDNFEVGLWETQCRNELRDFITNFKEDVVMQADPPRADEEDENVKAGPKSVLRHLELTSDHPPTHGIKWSGVDCATTVFSSTWLDTVIRTVIDNELKPRQEKAQAKPDEELKARQEEDEEQKAALPHSARQEVVNPYICHLPELYEEHGVSVVAIPDRILANVLKKIPETGVVESTLIASHVHGLETLRLVVAIPQGSAYKIYPVTDALLKHTIMMPTKRVSSAASDMAANSRLDKQYGPPPKNASQVDEKAMNVLKLTKKGFKQLPWDMAFPSAFCKLDAVLNAELINCELVQLWTFLYAHPGASSVQIAEHLNVFDQCELDMFLTTYMTKWVSVDESGNYYALPLREIVVRFF